MARSRFPLLLTGGLCAALCLSAAADPLPRSGSIAFHTGWSYSGTTLNAADKVLLGHGTVAGVTFNDSGAGPLHRGPAHCFEGYTVVDGKGRNKGFCAFGDQDGDRVFTEFSGTFDMQDGGTGTNTITGGTGKYAGIQGSGPWRCRGAGANGEFACTQRLDYRLP